MGIFHRAAQPHGLAGHTSVIAPGSKIEGDIRSEGGLHIDGIVTGSVEAVRYVIVTPGAAVYGNVRADEVYVGGVVVGDIYARRVEFYELGSCHGKTFGEEQHP